MKKVILFLTINSFLSFAALHASADSVIPGASSTNGNTFNQLISVGKTQMQIGAADRAHANYINQSSGAAIPRNGTRGTRADWQFGSSQTENVWNSWKTVEDAGNVTGLVVGDCHGDNSSNAHRAQMNQNRNDYLKENLISNAQCQENHPTLN